MCTVSSVFSTAAGASSGSSMQASSWLLSASLPAEVWLAFSFLGQLLNSVQGLSIVSQITRAARSRRALLLSFHTPLHASLRVGSASRAAKCSCFHALCAMLVTSHAHTKLLLHSSGPHRRIRREEIKNAGKLTLAVASDQVSTFTQASPATQEKLAISVNSLGVGFGTANSRKQVSLL